MSISLYISRLNNIFNEKLKEYYLKGTDIVLHRSIQDDDICFKFDIFFEEDKYQIYTNIMKENHINTDAILDKLFKKLFDGEQEERNLSILNRNTVYLEI